MAIIPLFSRIKQNNCRVFSVNINSMKLRKKTNFAADAMEFRIQTSHSIYTVILTPSTSGAGTTYPSGAHEFKPGFIGVRVTRSEVLYVCFVDRCLSFCTFSFANCGVCPSSIYGFRLPLWYIQTPLVLCCVSGLLLILTIPCLFCNFML
jgi:hypothetical protein